jgi:hypothetical protein
MISSKDQDSAVAWSGSVERHDRQAGFGPLGRQSTVPALGRYADALREFDTRETFTQVKRSSRGPAIVSPLIFVRSAMRLAQKRTRLGNNAMARSSIVIIVPSDNVSSARRWLLFKVTW